LRTLIRLKKQETILCSAARSNGGGTSTRQGSDDIVPAIIDTTVWIDFFRNSKTEQRICSKLSCVAAKLPLVDVILSEILQGIDSDWEFRSQSAAPIAKGTYSGMRRLGDLHAAHYRW
jgi:hypothetical protein